MWLELLANVAAEIREDLRKLWGICTITHNYDSFTPYNSQGKSLIAMARILYPPSMAPYKYYPLVGKAEIRLLHILPGELDDPLRGNLVTKDLDAFPSYQTLSYAWGEPNFTCRIDLDGDELSITPNLDSALRHLRFPDHAVTLWVDAICINQQSIPERNHQVSLMRRIYMGCVECKIYLGEERDGSEIVPEFLHTLLVGFPRLFLDEGLKPGEYVTHITHGLYTSLPPQEHPGWRAFRFFMSRPWFRRVWVIQEFALPRLVTMQCGGWTMDATVPGIVWHFYGMIGFAYLPCRLYDPVLDELADRGMNLIHEHLKIRLRCGNKSGLLGPISKTSFPSDATAPIRSLLGLIYTTSSRCDSLDPRDRFYGVFGLATDLLWMGLEVDYAKTYEDIEREIIEQAVKRGNGLFILKHAWCFSRSANGSPSWHPAFLQRRSLMFSCAARNRMEISNSNIESYLPAIRLDADARTLLVKGYILDVVEELGMDRPLPPTGAFPTTAVLEQAEAMIANSRFLRADENLPDSLWRTIIGNKTHGGRSGVSPLPPEYAAKYKQFRNFESIYQEKLQEDDPQDPARFLAQFKDNEDFEGGWITSLDMRFCITRLGMMALVPRYATVGDIIFTVLEDPDYETFAIRKRADGDCHEWIGRAYVHCVHGDEYREIEEGEPREIMVC